MLLVSGILALAMRYARVSAEYTADSYIAEQGRLLIRSAIEKTLLAISAHDRGNNSASLNCIESQEFGWSPRNGMEYNCSIKIKRYYLKNGVCSNVETVSISDERSHGMVLMEIEMNASRDGKMVSRIIRRSLQHP